MARLPHGKPITAEQLGSARENVARETTDPLGFAVTALPDLEDFDLLFPELQNDPHNLLPEGQATVAALKRLAETMVDFDGPDPAENSSVPAAYTYFGQFVDHDITLEVTSGAASEEPGGLFAPDAVPLPLHDIREHLRNGRTATLDLDSLYSPPAPRDPMNPAKMLVGSVSELGNADPPLARPAGKGIDNDVPREPRSTDPAHDRAALIGDPRNDENTIISQLQVAFLKAHNRLVDEGHDFDGARRILRQHYQFVVIDDFLKHVADPAIVDDVVEHGNRWFDAFGEPFFMPLEFSVAAYRFGHSMVRPAYDFNINFRFSDTDPVAPATLDLLFTFSALSGQLGFPSGTADASAAGTGTLPENWIIEWERLIGPGIGRGGRARRFDTRLAAITGGQRQALFNLPTTEGTPERGLAAMLSARNLLRGYRLRMPTGQAVAAHLALPVLSPDQLRAAVGERQAAELAAGGFLQRTPLWFYLLAEARALGGGERLGPVGSTIVAEVLVGLCRRSADSILRTPGWTASLPAQRPGHFELADLLRYAGVLAGGDPTLLHTVAAGETLTGIAAAELGDAARWVEIFAFNRNTLRHPDRLRIGQVLIMPSGPAMVPLPRFHAVQPGETLESIAAAQLGEGTRWREIFALNGDVITNIDVLVAGQVLALPPK
ncbi:hypothetical protein GCM10023215_01390 [Pseudonocardia yuanmonensis]|uniref:LysM domain-containing protein n=1 Tax=Pseudonocardia yuanmonensis TaxID=1095914 RepID=A0ABP8VXH8_9PSEU